MKKQSFTPKPLALALAGLFSLQAPASWAEQQIQDDDEIERIQVSGIRGSISESQFLKQNATSVVDVVVADDIGKFPDENLAEALQRIPGITITRNSGEGQNISVRGLSGGYNTTTLNGRKLASEFAGRDFNFDTIASELVNVLSVYKSPEARLIDGGIGAVINIETRKPLALDGRTVAASVKGIHESRSGDIHPHASFIIGDKTADSRLGALFSMVYSRKTLRADTYRASGFDDEDEDAFLNVDMNGDGVISDDERFPSQIPMYMYFANAQDVRTRIGSSLALQWQPNDRLDLNLDALYSRYTTDGSFYEIGFVNYDESWTPSTPIFTDPNFDELGRVNKIRQTGPETMVELLNRTTPRRSDTWQLGTNARFYLNDEWTLEADAAYSEARNKNNGDNRFIVARGFVDAIDIDYSTGHMLPDVVIEPGLTADQQYGAHYSLSSGTGVKDSVTDLKLMTQYQPFGGIMTRLDAGLTYLRQAKQQDGFQSRNPSQFSRGGYFLEQDGYAFDDSTVFQRGAFELFAIPSSVFRPANFDNFLKGENSLTPQPWPSFDYDDLVDYYRTINEDAANAGIVPSVVLQNSYRVTEAVTAAFVQADFESELAEMPYVLNLGLRASRTSVDSTGFSYDFSLIELNPETGEPVNNDWQDEVRDVGFSGSYTNILPSMNFRMQLRDDLQLRASAAEVLSRPSLGYLRPWAAPNFTSREQGLPVLSRGNANVEPERARQADLVLGWFFAEASALNVGVFYKDILSFISSEGKPGVVEGIEYFIYEPVSGDYGASIRGYELAWQQSFADFLPAPFDGLGFLLNYTYVDSNYEDPELKAAGLPFQGMSKNSYNAVLYYEQYGLQARLAYNWRSKYLLNPDAWGGPAWHAAYGQLDASLSYDINDKVTVFAEASNLTNNRAWHYIDRDDQVSYLERFGTQLSLGVRAYF
ncbi:TonB-dependent receptor [Alkalimonas delamerensis]|uniref:TonB-dependent receptor n=1 Tax=Alkalimonas delamerensis TaxID=265981 RepID=A0ABT9GRA4_9GAMM|nr:TonB-dependent receptor [Alkalimonas delamerensis]MDP4529505.1 TonB-dependent receptor [Alkalimonas delamerensis]